MDALKGSDLPECSFDGKHQDQPNDLATDQVYPSMSALREAAISYAKHQKFAVSTLRSSPRQLVLVCKHSGQQRTSIKQNELVRHKPSQRIACPFEIRAKPTIGQNWIIYQLKKEHNHEMATDIKAYAQHRRMTKERKEMIASFIIAGLSNTAIMSQLESEGIRNILKKDITNLRQAYNKQQKQQQQQKEREQEQQQEQQQEQEQPSKLS